MTLGQIAQRLGIPNHRAKYVIERFQIKPTDRIGILRVWDEDAFQSIKKNLIRLNGKRKKKNSRKNV